MVSHGACRGHRVLLRARIRVSLALRLVADEYVWAWRVFLTPAHGGPEREVSAQNSIAETIIDPAALRARARFDPPRLGTAGSSLRSLLARVDGRTSLAE